MDALSAAGNDRTSRRNRSGVLLVAAIAIGYGLVHAALRGLASPTLGQDDVIAAVLAQDWAWGYVPSNPPLYDWLLGLVHLVTGPTVAAAQFVRYGLLAASTIFLYLTALRILGDRDWAVLTALSLTLCFQIGWNIHEGVTHTAVLTTVVAATLWSYFRLLDRGSLADYVILGVCVGLGLVAKYNYGAILLTLGIASAFVPAARARLADARILITVAIAVLIAAPFALWLLDSGFSNKEIASRINPHSRASYLLRLARGLFNAVKSPISFLAPFVILVPLIFPQVLPRLGRALRSRGADGLANDHERLLYFQTLAALGVLLALAILGIPEAHSRYMHPLFLPAIILLMALARDQAPQPQRVRWYAAALASFAVLVLALRAALLTIGPPLCGPCHQLERFEPLAEALSKADLAPDTLIVTGDRFIAGNLRRLRPSNPVALVGRPTYVPLGFRKLPVSSLVVILPRTATEKDARAVIRRARLHAGALSAPPRVLDVAVDWTGHPWRPDGYRKSRWTVFFFGSGAGRT